MSSCSVPGCLRAHSGHGYCSPHRYRWRQHGPVDPAAPIKGWAKRLANCQAPDCDSAAVSSGWCALHYRRVLKHGDHAVVLKSTWKPGTGPAHHNWLGDEITYFSAHCRMRRTHGSASSRVCPCGAPAASWAYDHADPDQRHDPETGFAYSTKFEHYQALCWVCHNTADSHRVSA